MRRCATVIVFAMLGITPALAADAWRLPDPTRPGSQGGRTPAAGSHELVLQSTLVSPRRQRAVINGRAVGVGDRIGGKEVKEIRPSEVILSDGQRITSLRLTVKQGVMNKTGPTSAVDGAALSRVYVPAISRTTASQ